MKFSTAFWLRTASPLFRDFRHQLRHFSCAGTAFWLRISGILVTLRRSNLHTANAIRVAPVVSCIKPCRKTPVGGEPMLWKSSMQVITGHAAAQRERACGHSRRTEGATSRAEKGIGRVRSRLAILAALAPPAITMSPMAHIQSRPDTTGGALAGPFKRRASVRRPETPGGVRPQAIGLPSFGTYPNSSSTNLVSTGPPSPRTGSLRSARFRW